MQVHMTVYKQQPTAFGGSCGRTIELCRQPKSASEREESYTYTKIQNYNGRTRAYPRRMWFAHKTLVFEALIKQKERTASKANAQCLRSLEADVLNLGALVVLKLGFRVELMHFWAKWANPHELAHVLSFGTGNQVIYKSLEAGDCWLLI